MISCSPIRILLLALLLTTAGEALANGFRLTLPEYYDIELYVAESGNDRTGDGSQQRPFRSLEAALEYAKLPMGPLDKRLSTRINLAAGTYPESIDIREWGQGRDTLLTIEGPAEGQGMAVLKPAPDNPANQGFVWVEGKSAMVWRNLHFTEGEPGNFGGGLRSAKDYANVPDILPTDWLIENCHFRDGKGDGLWIGHIDYVTIRNCKAYNLEDTGMHLQTRHGLVEDVEIYNTNTTGRGAFNSGGLYLNVSDVVVRRVHIHDIPRGAGLRQDVGGEIMLIEDSVFERCHVWGVRLETARGPVTLSRCTIRENGDAGVYTDAERLIVEDCLIVDNPVGIRFQSGERFNQARCVPPGRGCVANNRDIVGGSQAGTLPLFGVERVSIVNTTIVAPGENGMIYQIPGDGEVWPELIHSGSWVGVNNVYWTPENPDHAFPTLGQETTPLAGWQQLTGSETTTRFAPPDAASPGVGGRGAEANQPAPLQFARAVVRTDGFEQTLTLPVLASPDVAWTVQSSEDWATLESAEGRGNGEVRVKLSGNPMSLRRSASLVVASDVHADGLMLVQENLGSPEPCPVASDIRVEPGETEATISWGGTPDGRIFAYGVNYRPAGEAWLKVPNEIRGTSVRLRGLRPGTEYQVRVLTICRDGISPMDEGTIRFTTTGQADPCEMIVNGGFEGAFEPWEDKAARMSLVEDAFSGEAALRVVTSVDRWSGVRQAVKAGLNELGAGVYEAVAYVKPENADADFAFEINMKNVVGSHWLRWDATATPVPGRPGWFKLTGRYEYTPSEESIWWAYFAIHGQDLGPFIVDDVSLKKVGCGR